jgi:hypothetical protein
VLFLYLQNSIEKLWACLQDLLQREVPKEHRHLVFYFFRCLVQGQYDKLGLMRVHFFRVIKTHDVPEDVAPRYVVIHSGTPHKVLVDGHVGSTVSVDCRF